MLYTIFNSQNVLNKICDDDNLQDNRNRTQTDYILSLIDGGDNPSTELVAKQLELRLKYEEAEMKLDKLEGCPTLPS